MQTFLNTLIEILPVLIISGTAIYIYHELVRFLKERSAHELQNRAIAGESPKAERISPALAQIQLQAAERFALYLERVAPDRLVMRIHQNGMSAKMLQSEMLRVIREEFDHNLSQQIYVSDGAWKLIKNAKEEMLKFVSATGASMKDGATGIELSRKLFETASKVDHMPNDLALQYLRKEVQALLRA